jgi:hypothetical protein
LAPGKTKESLTAFVFFRQSPTHDVQGSGSATSLQLSGELSITAQAIGPIQPHSGSLLSGSGIRIFTVAEIRLNIGH